MLAICLTKTANAKPYRTLRRGPVMPKYTMHSDYASYVALDVHSRSTTACAICLETAETRTKKFTGAVAAGEIAEWAASWLPGPTYFAYESGPCGFQLQRDLASLGLRCDVIAVTSIPRSPEDKYLKDDRRDAKRLLSEITKADGKAKAVYVPTTRTESLRDLTRARHDAVKAAKRSKQLASSLLTRYGHVWNERTPTGKLAQTWTPRYVSWAKRAKFDQQVTKETFDRYLQTALEDIDRAKALTKACAAEAGKPDVKPYVDALCRLLGVDVVTALAFVASMGDFERFANGRSVSAYYGLTPKRRESDGRDKGSRKMTKAGDALVRMTVLEGLCGIGAARTSRKKLKKGQAVSPQVEAEARKCNERNRMRYKTLVAGGKHPNCAKVAVASVAVRDMWFIGRMVQRELAARG